MNKTWTFLFLFLFSTVTWAQCFTVGTASTSTTTIAGDWTTGSNWDSGSPGCSINGEDDEIEVNVDMTMQDTGCSGGNLSMTAKTSLNVVSNSTLIIEGDMNLAGEEVCIYVQSGSTIQVLGDVNFSKNKVSMIIDGSFEVTGEFNCSGDCTGGGATFPSFGGSGTYSAGGGCTGFSGGQTQCDDSILPVELIFFDAHIEDDHVELNWATATEDNNDFFEIEKSLDGVTFSLLALIDGAGTHASILNYSYQDTSPYKGISYYRLSQTDFDGTHEILGLEVANYQNIGNTLHVYPNPTSGDLNISYNVDGQSLLTITDVLGRDVYNCTMNGSTKTTIDSNLFGPGVYFVRIIDALQNTNEQMRVVIK